MEFAERGEHPVAQLQHAGPAGVVPARRFGGDLQAGDRRTGRIQRRQGIGLGVEGIDGARCIVPLAFVPVAGAQACGNRRLILRLVAGELRADLEQGDVGRTAVGVPARGLDQVRQNRRPHDVEIGRDRVFQRGLRRRAAEQVGMAGIHK